VKHRTQNANTTYNNNNLRVRQTGHENEINSYVKVSVSGVGTVTHAVLRVYSKDVNMNIEVYESASTSWSEASITWNNAPGVAGGALDSQSVATGWYEFDVTSAITGDGTYSFVLKGDVNSGGRDFGSTEWSAGSSAPVLRITHE
jgi:hypothetical protein